MVKSEATGVLNLKNYEHFWQFYREIKGWRASTCILVLAHWIRPYSPSLLECHIWYIK